MVKYPQDMILGSRPPRQKEGESMAVIKRFFFDGEDIREEQVVRKENGVKPSQGSFAAKQEGRAVQGSEELCMLVSSLLEKDGKRYARVSFLRGEDTAEGIVPDGRLERVNGFSEEEKAGLEFYLAANKDAILAQAKQIDPLTNWLRTPPGK